MHPCRLFTEICCRRFKNALAQTNAIPLKKITTLIFFFLFVVFHISETNKLQYKLIQVTKLLVFGTRQMLEKVPRHSVKASLLS